MATREQVEREDGYGWPRTIGDLEAMPDSGLRAELINGDIIVSPPPGIWHQGVAQRIAVTLDHVCEEQGLVVLQGVGVKLLDEAFIPDVLVFRPTHPPIRGIYIVPQDVVLAVEVVSHSSRNMDRLTKPAALAANGIPFYLLVDPFPGPVKLSLFQLAGDSYDQIAQVEAGTPLPLPEPFGIELDTSRLG
jgi:Uma2 family endonuclease